MNEHDAVRYRIDPTGIPDGTLDRLRHLAVTRVLPLAPRFGEWLTLWIAEEQFRRREDPCHRHVSHLFALPELCDYSSVELGQTLRAVTVLSLIPLDGSLDDLIDRLTLAVSETAADRLEGKQ
jgi:hypothetical protein